MFKKLQNNMFGRLFNSGLLKCAIKQLQDPSKAGNMSSSCLPQLLTKQQAARGIQAYVSNYALSLLIIKFHDKDISIKIKAKFGLKPHLQQISMVVNITHYKKNVFVIADIDTGKSLTYQSILKITRGIDLVISPTIAFMKDQTQ